MLRALPMWLFAATMILYSGLEMLHAQDATPKQEPNAVVHAYRLDFSLNELESEKKVNTRRYSMTLAVPGERQEIKIGTRVPVVSESSSPNSTSSGPVTATQFQYLDVGTRIWCSLRDRGEDLELVAGSDISNIDAGPREKNGIADPPVLRQIKIAGSTLIVPGKSAIIGSADDPTSSRQFQLEVTATKLR
jgi:hypothetical protein